MENTEIADEEIETEPNLNISTDEIIDSESDKDESTDEIIDSDSGETSDDTNKE